MVCILLLLAGGCVTGAIEPEPAAPPVVDAARTAEARHDALLQDLRSIPVKRAALGDAEHREGLVKTEAWLLERIKSIGLEAQSEEFVWTSVALKNVLFGAEAQDDGAAERKNDARLRFRNYVVELRGTDLAQEVLILGAHYDAVPLAPGADDNASGVVGLLEIARTLRHTKHRRTIRLVFFTLEEVGLVGSTMYVNTHKSEWKSVPAKSEGEKPTPPKETVIGMVSLECIGYFSDEAGSQTSPIPKIGGKPILDLKISDTGNFIGIGGIARHRGFSQKLGAAMQAAEPRMPVLIADSLPFAPPDFLRSDHAPFLAAGIPAVILTDTANFRNPHYHTPTDTVETLDVKRLAQVVSGVAAAASVLAEPMAAPAPRKEPAP